MPRSLPDHVIPAIENVANSCARTPSLSQASAQYQPAKQQCASIRTSEMLLIEVGNSARYDYMAESPRDICDCFFHSPAQSCAKPSIEWWREALLLAPSDFRWNPIRQASAQQGFALAVGKLITNRQASGKCKEVSIQKWSATFHRAEHAGAVHLH